MNAKFKIFDNATCTDLGEWSGIDEQAALDAMAFAAGYGNWLSAIEQGGFSDDLEIEEVA